MKATITEKGNGFPEVGELIYHQLSDTVYRVTGGEGHIQTGPSGHYIEGVEIEEVGSASDISEDDFDTLIEYGVDLG